MLEALLVFVADVSVAALDVSVVFDAELVAIESSERSCDVVIAALWDATPGSAANAKPAGVKHVRVVSSTASTDRFNLPITFITNSFPFVMTSLRHFLIYGRHRSIRFIGCLLDVSFGPKSHRFVNFAPSLRYETRRILKEFLFRNTFQNGNS